MLSRISSACIVQAGQVGPLYVNTKISMPYHQQQKDNSVKLGGRVGGRGRASENFKVHQFSRNGVQPLRILKKKLPKKSVGVSCDAT